MFFRQLDTSPLATFWGTDARCRGWAIMTKTISILAVTLIAFAFSPTRLISQSAPPAPDAVWQPKGLQTLEPVNLAKSEETVELDPTHPYRLT